MRRIIQDYSAKLPPLAHQVEAIEYLAQQPTAALFDEQGLGKTKIVIDALRVCMSAGSIDGVLVVAPLSLVHNWESEVRKHSHLIPVVLRGSRKEKKYRILTGANFYITNYESVVAELDTMIRFCRSRHVAVVLDEAARIKNPDTQAAQALFRIAPLTEKRVIVTGTPVANTPVDVWAQFFFLDQGRLLGDDFSQFKSEYNEKLADYDGRLKHLRDLIAGHSIRRMKDNVLELPEKVYRQVEVQLTGKQRALYEELKNQLRIEITDLDGQTIVDDAENILKKLLRLTQLASNPGLVDKGYIDTPAKFPVLADLVRSIVAEGEKAIVWSSFVDNILLLRGMLSEFKPLVIYGDISVPDRALTVEKFQDDPRRQVLIANPAAAREGLTLTSANHAIYLDRNFSLTDYLQSQDRIHRISQTKRCFIYKLIASGTIDEYVDRIIELKSDIASFVQGDSHAIQQDTLDSLVNKQVLLQLLGG